MHASSVINTLLEDFTRAPLPEIDLSLTRMERLLAALGNPERRVPPVIHVAGTNGKGSTIAFLASIYGAAGYRVHRYHSPHLVRFHERMTLAGAAIEDALLEEVLREVAEAALGIPVTFFEATTAAAFLAFSRIPADLLLLEVGLGGRLDATNVIPSPLASVITPIGMDHMEFLGDSLVAIAREKAGIMKPNVPCFLGKQTAEVGATLMEEAQAKGSPLTLQGRDWTAAPTPSGMRWNNLLELPAPSLVGAHQYDNAGLAVAVVQGLAAALPVSHDALARGIAEAVWPARLQRLHKGAAVRAWGGRGAVMLDGGHNAHAAEALAVWMAEQTLPIYMVCGMMGRKDARGYFAPLAPHLAGLVCIPIPNAPDGQSPDLLAEAARVAGVKSVAVAENISAALQALHPEGGAVLLIAGSLYLAGELLREAA